MTAARPGDQHGSSVVVQPDGAIVVASATTEGSDPQILVQRFLDSGAADPGFGTAGVVLAPLGAQSPDANWVLFHGVTAWMVQLGDGRLVVAGNGSLGGVAGPVLARFESDGSPRSHLQHERRASGLRRHGPLRQRHVADARGQAAPRLRQLGHWHEPRRSPVQLTHPRGSTRAEHKNRKVPGGSHLPGPVGASGFEPRPLDPQSSALTRLRYAPGHRPPGDPGVQAAAHASRTAGKCKAPATRAHAHRAASSAARQRRPRRLGHADPRVVPRPTPPRRPRRTPPPARPARAPRASPSAPPRPPTGAAAASAAATHASASRRGSAPVNVTARRLRRALRQRLPLRPVAHHHEPRTPARACDGLDRQVHPLRRHEPATADRQPLAFAERAATPAAPRPRGPTSGTSIAGGSTWARAASRAASGGRDDRSSASRSEPAAKVKRASRASSAASTRSRASRGARRSSRTSAPCASHVERRARDAVTASGKAQGTIQWATTRSIGRERAASRASAPAAKTPARRAAATGPRAGGRTRPATRRASRRRRGARAAGRRASRAARTGEPPGATTWTSWPWAASASADGRTKWPAGSSADRGKTWSGPRCAWHPARVAETRKPPSPHGARGHSYGGVAALRRSFPSSTASGGGAPPRTPSSGA